MEDGLPRHQGLGKDAHRAQGDSERAACTVSLGGGRQHERMLLTLYLSMQWGVPQPVWYAGPAEQLAIWAKWFKVAGCVHGFPASLASDQTV